MMKRNNPTFIVQMMSNENETCQGTINWVDRNETTPFRSTLELIHLIESAVNDGKEE